MLLAASLGAACFGASAAPATVDETRLRELEAKLESSLRLIETLDRRIKELEAHDAAPAEAPLANAPVQRLDQKVAEISASAGSAAPQQTLRGFADVGFSQASNDGQKGFGIGNLDFYFTPHLAENVKALAEVVLEYNPAGELALELERIQVGYTFSDAATIWMGRFHSPLGSFNATFHHGALIQTALARPRFLDFEDRGGILPVHTIGVWLAGSGQLGSGRVHYDLFTGNNPDLADGEVSPLSAGSTHAGLSVGANAGYAFGDALSGLDLGLHGYRATVRDSDTDTQVSRLNVFGAYAVYDTPEWELLSEYYAFRNDNLLAGPEPGHSWATFAQLGRHWQLWTPYLRYEKASLDADDPYFALQALGRSYDRRAAGIRYELTPKSALKLEYTNTHSPASTLMPRHQDEVRVQWAFRF